ncbi:MAG TPA: hypothetical protein VMF30_12510 [Pirellulales bacterium]|nr:hypothetical protein [Pirellulales bacterium]
MPTQQSPPSRRWFAAALSLAMVAACTAWLALAGSPARLLSAAETGTRSFSLRTQNPTNALAPTAPAHNASQRQREGTNLVDVPGHFKLTGDRATFFPTTGETHFIGLENQNLERIAATIGDIPDQLNWLVSGTITEYRGANYLLVTKAILRDSPSATNRQGSSTDSQGGNLSQGF